MAAVLLVGAVVLAWSNHMDSGFHFDDQHTIVRNEAVHSLSSAPQFFRDPATFSIRPEYADYRPVLSTLFAIDHKLGGSGPFVHQAENFLWLLLEVFLVYLVVLAMPGMNHAAAMSVAAICGLHPVLADLVNYPLQRGSMIGGAGVCGGLLLWLAWPRMLPVALPLKFHQFPRNRTEKILRWAHPHLTRIYAAILRAPLPFYFVPVVLAMLAEPAAAVFPLLLLLWIVLFEGGRNKLRVLPSALICGGYWLAHTVWILRLTSAARLEPFSYLYSQPWVAIRFLLRVLAPAGLSASMNMKPLDTPWSPLALAGYAGVALIVLTAFITAKKEEWRPVSFGLWWFVIAFAPQAIVPQYSVSADSRILMPLAGIAVAAVAAALALVRKAPAVPSWQTATEAGAWSVMCLLVCGMGWLTWERNRVWITDETVWQDISERHPEDGTALLSYGELLLDRGDLDRGFQILSRGAALLPNDPAAELALARANSSLNRDTEAEKHYRRALQGRLSYPWSAYAEWLEEHQRHEEALKLASHALGINSRDVAARHILMEELSRHSRWDELRSYAAETLRIAPTDQPAKRSRVVAQLAIEEIGAAEKAAAAAPSLEALLRLSVVYFRHNRLDDAVRTARRATELYPAQPFAYSNLSAAYHAMGKIDESIEALRAAIRIDPNLPNARENLVYELSVKNSAKN